MNVGLGLGLRVRLSEEVGHPPARDRRLFVVRSVASSVRPVPRDLLGDREK